MFHKIHSKSAIFSVLRKIGNKNGHLKTSKCKILNSSTKRCYNVNFIKGDYID